jgi:hypothetical protein
VGSHLRRPGLHEEGHDQRIIGDRPSSGLANGSCISSLSRIQRRFSPRGSV